MVSAIILCFANSLGLHEMCMGEEVVRRNFKFLFLFSFLPSFFLAIIIAIQTHKQMIHLLACNAAFSRCQV